MEIPVVSYSSLNTYAQCPYGYYLKYIVHESSETADFTGALPGNVSHKLAELFFKKKNEEGVVDWNIFDTHFDVVFNNYAKSPNVSFGPDAFASNIRQAKLKVKVWSENLADMIKSQGLVKPITISEFRFGSYKNPLKISDKLFFTGGPDIFSSVSMDSPGVLVDFKASDTTFHINEKQIFLYALALKKDLGVDVSMAGFFLFKSRDAIWKKVSEDRLSETIAWAESIVDNIVKENFEPSPSKSACRLCPFKKVCKHSSFIVEKKSSLKTVVELKTENLDFEIQGTPDL